MDVPSAPLAFSRAGVLGAGTMGTGIAYVLARSGATVRLAEPDPAQHARSVEVMTARSDVAPELLSRVRRCAGPADPGHGLRRPDRLIGLHFVNPVWAMSLVEIVRQPVTSDQALADAFFVWPSPVW